MRARVRVCVGAHGAEGVGNWMRMPSTSHAHAMQCWETTHTRTPVRMMTLMSMCHTIADMCGGKQQQQQQQQQQQHAQLFARLQAAIIARDLRLSNGLANPERHQIRSTRDAGPGPSLPRLHLPVLCLRAPTALALFPAKHMPACTQTCTHTCTHACTQTCTHACTHACTHTCTPTYTHACTHAAAAHWRARFDCRALPSVHDRIVREGIGCVVVCLCVSVSFLSFLLVSVSFLSFFLVSASLCLSFRARTCTIPRPSLARARAVALTACDMHCRMPGLVSSHPD